MNVERDRSAWLHGPDTPCQVQPRHTDHPRRLVLLGPPGVGKGTQAAFLAAATGACHLSTGDVFRHALSCHTVWPSRAMQTALDAMHTGALVADSTVLALVRERQECLRCHGGFLLDGFPRTVPQAAVLDLLLAEHGLELDAVLNYELPLATLLARVTGRLHCPSCHAVYHASLQPPRDPGYCDACGTDLVQRADDQPHAARVRQAAYQADTAPLVAYYHDQGRLVHVPAHGTPQETFDRTLTALAHHAHATA